MISPALLSPYAVEHHEGSRKSNPYGITSILLSPYAIEHHEGSRKSNPYGITSVLLSPYAVEHHEASRKSNPYGITSVLLSPYAVEHHEGSQKSNPYGITSVLLSPYAVEHHEASRKSNPYGITSVLLSPYAVEHHEGSQKSNPYGITSILLSLLLIVSPFSSSPLMTIVWLHLILILWDTVTKGTAGEYPLITLLRIGIHSPRNYLLSYRDFCVLSFRTVGVKLDSNCCPYLLSLTVSAPRTRWLGSQVARFARPFESRPTDPIRREVYRQLAANKSTASSSGWVAPSATLSVTPPPLEKGTEESAMSQVPSKPKGKRKRPL